MTNSWMGRFGRGLLLVALVLGSVSGGAAQTAETTLTLPFIVNGYELGTGEIVGTVRALATNQGIEGAQVCANGLCALTDVDGKYRVSAIPNGAVRLTASASTYLSEVVNLPLQTGQEVNQDFTLMDDLGAQNLQKQVLLYWRTEPKFPIGCIGGNTEGCYDNDLDSYLWLKSKLTPVMVNLEYKGDCFNFPHVCLETDAWSGTGPEVISFPSLESNNAGNSFYYAVVNYYWQRAEVPPLNQSQARVVIRDVDGSQLVFNVPTVGDGPMWYVFEMDWHGVVTPTNCIIDYQNDPNVPPSCP